ncbi:hypothetical protein [Bacillus sp. JCM 19041]|uniref:hypothetical protein n=1 Tax=Bacillus sp. JCM 19041 TaxID=1460637 RepID=UPI0006CF781C
MDLETVFLEGGKSKKAFQQFLKKHVEQFERYDQKEVYEYFIWLKQVSESGLSLIKEKMDSQTMKRIYNEDYYAHFVDEYLPLADAAKIMGIGANKVRHYLEKGLLIGEKAPDTRGWLLPAYQFVGYDGWEAFAEKRRNEIEREFYENG